MDHPHLHHARHQVLVSFFKLWNLGWGFENFWIYKNSNFIKFTRHLEPDLILNEFGSIYIVPN